MKSVYLIFLTELDNEDNVLLFQKNPNKPHKLLRTDITYEDNLSSSIAASKIILDYLNNIELQNFTFCKQEYLSCVDFAKQEYAEKHIWTQSTNEEKKLLRHKRNLQSHLWTIFFNQCPLWNDDDEKNFYYIIRLQQQDLQYMVEKKGIQPKLVKVQELNNNLLKYGNKFLDLQKNIISKDYLRINGRIILHFNFKTKENMVYEAPGGYLDTVSIYNGLFRRKYDNWNQYNVAYNINDYPSDEILRKANFIIMPGNRISVYSNKQWIKDVKNILKKAYETNQKIKILGICFGFQILTEALGGKVEAMQQHFFVHGNTILKHNIQLMKQFKLFQGMDLKETTMINEAHGDEITIHPDYFVLVSSSSSCKNEIMISKDERLLMFQGHPEYTSGGMRMFGLSYKFPSKALDLNDAIKDSFRQYPQEQDAFHLQLCFKFLKEPL